MLRHQAILKKKKGHSVPKQCLHPNFSNCYKDPFYRVEQLRMVSGDFKHSIKTFD